MNITENGKGAWTVRIGEKGQIVIPKAARDMFGIVPGEEVLILGDKDRGLAILAKDDMNKVIDSIMGGLK